MKVLLLGGSGRIGSRLKPILENFGFSVTAPAKKQLNLSKPGYMDRIEEINPDIIVNASGITNREKAERNQLLADKVHVTAVQKLVDYCKQNNNSTKKKWLVQLSSGNLYPWGDTAASEKDPTFGYDTKYEESKLRGELAVLANLDNFLMFRLGYVYVVPELRKLYDLGCDKLLVANRIISPISADLAAQSIGIAINQISDPCTSPGIYNLACRGVTTVIGFMQFFGNLGSERVLYSPHQRPPMLRSSIFPGCGLSVEKFENEFNFSLPYWETELYEKFSLTSNQLSV